MAVVCPPVCPSACPVPGPKLKMELRSKLKIGGKETHAWWPVIHLKTKRSKVKVTRPTNAELEYAPYTVATRPWKLLKVLEKIIPFFQGLESPWKWNRALKVLEFDVRGPESPWISILHHRRYHVWRFCSHYIAPQSSTLQLHFIYLIGGLLKYC